MKICSKCGKALEEGELFCTICGTDANKTRESLAEEEARQESEFCASYKRILRYERLAFKIGGIVYLVLTVLLAVITFVLMGSEGIAVPPALVEYITGGGDVDLNTYLFSYVIAYCVISAVNMILSKKAESCMDEMDSDIRYAVRRYTSFGTLFLIIFTNEVALVFYIINFIKTRSNAALLSRIVAKQCGSKGDFAQ